MAKAGSSSSSAALSNAARPRRGCWTLFFREFSRPQGQPADSGEHMEWVGIVAQLHRLRSVLQSLYRRFAARSRGRVPLAQQRVSALGAIRLRPAAAVARSHPPGSFQQADRERRQAGRAAASRFDLYASGRNCRRIGELLRRDPAAMRAIHAGLYEVYISYPIEAALQT